MSQKKYPQLFVLEGQRKDFLRSLTQGEEGSKVEKASKQILDLYMTSCGSLTLDLEGLHHEDSEEDSFSMDKWQEVIIQAKVPLRLYLKKKIVGPPRIMV